MIIQGSNAPIVLTFENDMSSISDFSAVLVSGKNIALKQWRKDDIEIAEKDISLPLSQAETFLFPDGKCTLEIKWVDENDIHFANDVSLQVQKRFDKTRFSIGG